MSESSTETSPSASLAICVLGMHRSGTSALTRVLNLLGMELGDNLLKPGPDNPTGFWEHDKIARCHAKLLRSLGSHCDDLFALPDGWAKRPELSSFHDELLEVLRTEFAGKPLWGFKDPRTCRTVPFWWPLFDQVHASPRFVIIVRNPDEVAASLAARNEYPYDQSLLIAIRHMLMAERNTRGRLRMVMTYEQLMTDWQKPIARIARTLGVQWPHSPDDMSSQINEFLDPGLRHHRTRLVTTAEQAIRHRKVNPRVANWAFGIYNLLEAAAAEDSPPIDSHAVEQLGLDFNQSLPNLVRFTP